MVGFGNVARVVTPDDANLEVINSKNKNASRACVEWNGHAVRKGGQPACCLAYTLSTLFSMAGTAAFITLLVIGKRTGNRPMMLGTIGVVFGGGTVNYLFNKFVMPKLAKGTDWEACFPEPCRK